MKLTITDEMVDAACEALSRSEAVYPDGTARTPVSDWFDLDAQDAVDFGVLQEPKWHWYSDIRVDQHEAYIARVLREPMRAALAAALSLEQGEKP